MIRASDLLRLAPNLPQTTQTILTGLVSNLNDPMIHMPGLPLLPPFPKGEIPAPIRDAIVAMMGDVEFEFYQTAGVKLTIKGQSVGGLGANISEILNLKNPAPNIKVTPVFEMGTSNDNAGAVLGKG